MLRLWSTRTSVSQCGMLGVRTRLDLSGDTTSKTHRWVPTVGGENCVRSEECPFNTLKVTCMSPTLNCISS